MTTNRRLAAIMVADVVGYSRLMEADEAGTLAALKERRKGVLEPVIKAHGGRIVKVMGDGVLVEFGSAVNAVQGAIELQKKMAAANEGVDEAKRVVLRIGINLGDVIGEGSDIYGEGVNIAARLEPLAEAGGICVSDKVHREVASRMRVDFEDLGEQRVKNIAAPVRAFAIGSTHTVGAETSPRTAPPTVAVLPFDNMSGEAEQDYFSNGITEDIIAELSRFKNLLVIARNSSFAFKGHAGDLRVIGRKLNAQYVVEGSVRKAGRRIRITAQLIDVASGNHVWSERFDRDLDDIFAIQDEVAATIVGKVAGQVQTADIERARRRTGSLAAYDHYLRGLEYYNRFSAEDIRPAMEALELAVAEDANFAEAHALLATVQAEYAISLWEPGQQAEHKTYLDKSLQSGKRAVALDANSARCHAALGHSYLTILEFDLATYHIDIGRMLNPNDPDVIASQCVLEAFGDHPEKALDLIDHARKLSPILPNWYHLPWSVALYQLKRYAEAADVLERATAKRAYALRYLAACYAQMGQMEKARAMAAESLRVQPGFSLAVWMTDELFRSQASLLHMRDGMRKAGLPE